MRLIFITGFASLLVFVLLIFFYPLPRSLNPSWSKIVRYGDGKVMRTYVSADEKWRIFLPLDKIDPLLVKTTILYEDRFFLFHHGINPLSLIRALYKNIRAKRIVSGGSTLTMQLARIAEPKPRNIIAKLIEIFRAAQFELRLGKKRILELYLNLAPYGGNIEGIGAACLGYYGRLPEKMTPEEISFLVSLPQSPSLRRPKEKPSPINGRNSVLKVMFKNGLVNGEEYKRGLNAAVPHNFKPFPFEAPHAADFLFLRYPESDNIPSTIDRNIQTKVSNILWSYKKKIFDAGASNANVVVMENSTRKVRALIGSLDYFDEANQGQVRGFYAFRSPGSALKPFLYIMALEKGLINNAMLIEDAPYRFGDFEPSDFSGTWLGLVTAEEALSLSLNLPFILILKRYGYSRFIERLKDLGFNGPLTFDSYGLPIITGGMDVRLVDLTNLYLTLARGGMHGEYVMLEDEMPKQEKSLFRPGAVLLTLKALSKRNRPDAPHLSRFTIPKGKIYWKTGTSFGRRDALSIGFQKDYTVGVWVGNFSGEGSDSIVGALAAAPIMFDIIRAIEHEWQGRFPWERFAESEIENVEVCKFSGFRPGPHCPETKMVAVLKNAHPYIECPYHKKFIIEKSTGYRASPWKSYKKGEIVEKVFLVYPPQVQKVMGKKAQEPEFPPECRLVDERLTLQIVSPVDEGIYFIPSGVRNAGFIPLQAFTANKGNRIHWFINDHYRGATGSGEIMEIVPEGPTMKIVAQDEAGTNKTVRINIEKEP